MKAIKKSIYFLLMIILILAGFSKGVFATQTGKAKQDAKLRKETNNKSIILEIIPKNDEFEILEKTGDWYKVNYKKIKGYVLSQYVEEIGKNNETNTSENNKTQIQENQNQNNNNQTQEVEEKQLEIGDKAQTKNETKLYIRPLVNSNTIKTIANNKQVSIVEILNHWAFITTDTDMGWVCLDNLTSKITNDPQNNSQSKIGYVIANELTLRETASTAAKSLKKLSQNTKVTILEEQEQWDKIEIDGQQGYVLKSYISDKKVEVTSRSSVTRKIEEEQKEDTNKTNTSSSKGEEIVKYAKQYLGSKYVYGGSSPKGFDCSGFTMYVYKQFGVSLSHSATAQSKIGTSIKKENLQLGDLVFFSDYKTFQGIGHCGIYIGDGKFIHASTEKTGVITSSLNSGSYIKRYVKATRLI